ncbi:MULTISPECIES: phage head-tail joining protein [Thioclava]|uniref:Phage tail protein n=1 Tax=Thioclava kandeliae TaxID=3070818 RepID=A0ABV1SIC5_9RHOB
MAWTQSDITQMERAIATGARVVQINGERVEYRSLEEMRSILVMMKEELRGAAAGAFQVSYPKTLRGL